MRPSQCRPNHNLGWFCPKNLTRPCNKNTWMTSNKKTSSIDVDWKNNQSKNSPYQCQQKSRLNHPRSKNHSQHHPKYSLSKFHPKNIPTNVGWKKSNWRRPKLPYWCWVINIIQKKNSHLMFVKKTMDNVG